VAIIGGIRLARVQFDNVKKMLLYMLTSKVPMAMSFLCSFLMNAPQPMDFIPIMAYDLIVFSIPAFVLLFECAEGDVLVQRVPRDIIHDRMVSHRMMMTATMNGFWHTAAAYTNYFVLAADQDWLPIRLMAIDKPFNRPYENKLTDSYSNQWNYNSRVTLLRMVDSAYFIGIVVVMWGTAMTSRVRRQSVFNHVQIIGGNLLMVPAITLSTTFAAIIIFSAEIFNSDYLHLLHPIILHVWAAPVVYLVIAFLSDELRRFIIRRTPDGWLESETCI
jgi:sodium/potassium-transporting ATPase subunit alpha